MFPVSFLPYKSIVVNVGGLRGEKKKTWDEVNRTDIKKEEQNFQTRKNFCWNTLPNEKIE